jgi:hypothetical protein
MFMACFRWHDEPITKLNDKQRTISNKLLQLLL